MKDSLLAQLVKNLPAMPGSTPGSIPGSTPIFLGFPCSSAGKESTCNVGVLGSIPRSTKVKKGTDTSKRYDQN